MNCLLAAALSLAVSSAFVTPPRSHVRSSAFLSSTESTEVEAEPVAPTPVVLLNGWAPNPDLACYGLPGALAPTGYFDPLGFAQRGIVLNDIKRNRESEVRLSILL